MALKDELQRIISGVGKNTKGDIIQAGANYLRKSKEASSDASTIEFTKDQETEQLINWINKELLWYNAIDENLFLAEGAEQKVYLERDGRHVIKLNSCIFYNYWEDYFHSLLIHNFFFQQTAYSLIGFYLDNHQLKSVVRQPYIEVTEPTSLPLVKEFLFSNGFKLKKDNDYFHPDIGLILEDLHEENVLTNQGTLFFIDTVFYLRPEFFNKLTSSRY